MTNTPDDLNTPMIAVIGFLGTVTAAAIIVLLVVVFYRVKTREEFVKDTSRPQVEVSQLAALERGGLADFGLLDREKQVYAIPISRAMELTVSRRRADPEGPPGTDPPGEVPTEEDSPTETEEPSPASDQQPGQLPEGPQP